RSAVRGAASCEPRRVKSEFGRAKTCLLSREAAAISAGRFARNHQMIISPIALHRTCGVDIVKAYRSFSLGSQLQAGGDAIPSRSQYPPEDLAYASYESRMNVTSDRVTPTWRVQA